MLNFRENGSMLLVILIVIFIIAFLVLGGMSFVGIPNQQNNQGT